MKAYTRIRATIAGVLCRRRGHQWGEWAENRRVLRGRSRICERAYCGRLEWSPCDASMNASIRRFNEDVRRAKAALDEFGMSIRRRSEGSDAR